MSVIEEKLHELIQQMDDRQRSQLLNVARQIANASEDRFYSAAELIKMPAAQRAAHVAQAFEAAEEEAFETFEAYSEEPIADDD